MRIRTTLVGALMLVLAASAGCAEPSSSGDPDAPEAPTAVQAAVGQVGETVEVVAVGDIVCAPGSAVTVQRCRHAENADLAQELAPDAVIGLGDLQYESGGLNAFRSAYDESWGALRDITYPVPGNHEYRTAGAAGYYQYFSGRQPGSPGYYSRRLGSWRAYFLNSNCTNIDCGAQRAWLRRSLTNNPATCTLFAAHHPRFSSGEHGSQQVMRSFTRIGFRNGVDVVLGGHDHHYERFRRQNHDGARSARGFFQFVSGAGGKTHYDASAGIRGSLKRNDRDFGLLRLTLRPGDFDFAFTTIDGQTIDQGTRTCA